ncbi:MAG TPA: hypothetical protein VF498_08290 [Anaerolineales bacterium]
MNDPNVSPNPRDQPPAPTQPPSQDWREMRRAEREAARQERRAWRGEMHISANTWLWGVALIVVGVILLAQNAGIITLRNWWALFILIPAVGSFIAAWNIYNAAGRLNSAARSSLFGGVVLTLIAILFLVELGKYWPVLLIVGGAALLVTTLLPN